MVSNTTLKGLLTIGCIDDGSSCGVNMSSENVAKIRPLIKGAFSGSSGDHGGSTSKER
jgi:hypothetical protein